MDPSFTIPVSNDMLKIYIKQHERGLLFRRGDFRAILGPGEYRLWANLARPGRDWIEAVSLTVPRFEHPLLSVIARTEDAARELTVLNLGETQRALIWREGRLLDVIGPGLHAYWNAPERVGVERIEAGEGRFDHPRLDTVLHHAQGRALLEVVEVDAASRTLLLRNGELVDELEPGRYAYWKGGRSLRAVSVDGREQTLDVAGQEIMTADKVTLRLTLAATYRVTDARRAVLIVGDHAQTLYREAQLALRAAIGTRTLDALLADKEAVGGEIRHALEQRAAAFGVEVRGVGVKDIILPGEMKVILNQVIEAEKKAQADLIRRREETASARSQANTAKLLGENPLLVRFKELEMLQQVLSGSNVKIVLGRGDLIEQVRTLVKPA